MRIAVLGAPDSWYLKDLQRAAGMEHRVTPLPFSRIHSEISPTSVHFGSASVDLADYDCLLVRTMPPGTLEQVVFRMDVLGRWEASDRLTINPARAIETAVDKYLSLAKLHQVGLPVPRTFACQSVDDAMSAFFLLGNDVALKPLFGSEGRGITRVTDEAIALRVFKTLDQLGAVIYLQEFIRHEGCDYRLLVLGDRVFGIRRFNENDWRTNVSRGARCEKLKVTDELAELAMKATLSVGAMTAGIDLLPSRDGRVFVLEVNAVPGWRALSQTLEIDIGKAMIDYIAHEYGKRGLHGSER